MEITVDVGDAVELRALLPYLLDPMAAATRRDVLSAQSTVHERHTRRMAGIYYTPGDVAYLMVAQVQSYGQASDTDLWFDPAHGSGVFLRAMYAAMDGHPDAADRIYGVDLNAMAAETASFVLTAEDLVRNPDAGGPWERWHRFRRNLATGDSLLIDTGDSTPFLDAIPRPCHIPLDGSQLGRSKPWKLQSVFPETAEHGFSRVVANPPYAPLQHTAATTHIPDLHHVTGRTARQDISPIFTELCANLLPRGGALGIVLPLSVVASTRSPFPELRRYLADQPGRLEFRSFDRVPDAIFGDDIKTRNAIVYLDKSGPNELIASPLHRWTSRTREAALGNMPTVSVANIVGTPGTIPKIGTHWEHALLMACRDQRHYLERWQMGRRLAPLDGATTTVAVEASNLLALAPTAYNFLGVIRDPSRAVTDGHDSQNGHSILHFASEQLAAAAYALLSSRLAFWLWHVTGDGFHVTNALHRNVPIPWGNTHRTERLAKLGDRLWKAVLQSPAISNNRGRTTVTYPTWRNTDIIDEIDTEIEQFVGISYAIQLAAWHERLVVVDPASDRRDLIQRKKKQ